MQFQDLTSQLITRTIKRVNGLKDLLHELETCLLYTSKHLQRPVRFSHKINRQTLIVKPPQSVQSTPNATDVLLNEPKTYVRGNKMNEAEMMSEIRDANLNYLMLSQQMIRTDKATAIFRLGISKDIADLLEGLSNLQLLKLSSSCLLYTSRCV